MPRFWATVDAAAEAGSERHQHVLDGRRPIVLGRKNLGMVGAMAKRGSVGSLFPGAEELLDRTMAVRTADPLWQVARHSS